MRKPSKETTGGAYCLGFLQGTRLMNDYLNTPSLKYGFLGAKYALFCQPKISTNAEAARIVVKYLRDHPERLHEDEFILALAALNAAFPCANEK